MTKRIAFLFSILCSLTVFAEPRDTLKLVITKINRNVLPDSVSHFVNKVDTLALQEVKTDTAKIVKDSNTQDLEETKYRVRFMGSVRVNGFYDFAGMKSTEGFMPYDIPVGSDDIPGLSSVYIGARQSRIGFEGDANTQVGKIRTYIEVDFASTSESYFRLRHAYAEWNYWKLGYTHTTFMDNASLPQTVEFEGPNSSLSKRHGLVRYERIMKKGNIIGVSLESPKADYYNPADSVINKASNQRNLDLAGRYKYFNNHGHIQVAGILRSIDILNEGKMGIKTGWGLLFSSTIRFTQQHLINAQYSFGKGIAYYYVGTTKRQLDAVYDPVNDDMVLKRIQGGFINYSFRYNPSWILSVIAGISYMKGAEFEPDDTFKSSRYYGTNIFYKPIETISLGIEATSGSRENLNQQTGNATRISMLAKFDF
jgi:hypothetical protein